MLPSLSWAHQQHRSLCPNSGVFVSVPVSRTSRNVRSQATTKLTASTYAATTPQPVLRNHVKPGMLTMNSKTETFRWLTHPHIMTKRTCVTLITIILMGSSYIAECAKTFPAQTASGAECKHFGPHLLSRVWVWNSYRDILTTATHTIRPPPTPHPPRPRFTTERRREQMNKLDTHSHEPVSRRVPAAEPSSSHSPSV